MPFPSQKSEQSFFCAKGIYFASFYDFVLLEFGTVPRVWYFFLSHIFIINIYIRLFIACSAFIYKVYIPNKAPLSGESNYNYQPM